MIKSTGKPYLSKTKTINLILRTSKHDQLGNYQQGEVIATFTANKKRDKRKTKLDRER